MKTRELANRIVAHVDACIVEFGQQPDLLLREAVYDLCFEILQTKITVQAVCGGNRLLDSKKAVLRQLRDMRKANVEQNCWRSRLRNRGQTIAYSSGICSDGVRASSDRKPRRISTRCPSRKPEENLLAKKQEKRREEAF